MTQQEWQLLCRQTKNDGSYHKLIKAIKWWVNAERKMENKISNENAFISHFSFCAIKFWYLDAFDAFKLNKK